MAKFKQHAQEEVAVPPTVTHNFSSSSSFGSAEHAQSAGFILTHHPSTASQPKGEEYKLEYYGRHEVPPPATATSDQVEIIDSLVSKISDGGHKRSKKLNFRLRKRANSKTAPTVGVDTVDGDHINDSTTNSSSSSLTVVSDVSIIIKSGVSPTEHSEGGVESGEELPSSPLDPADQHCSCSQPLKIANGHLKHHSSDSADFDTLPELANLESSTEFQALSLKTAEGWPVISQKVRLMFSGVSVVVLTEHTNEIILKKSIRNIACCAQGKIESEYIAFTSKHKESKKYFCYLFLAKNSKMAVKVLESFKSAFVHTLSLTMPPAICDGCPLKRMEQLCKSLEGVSTQVAQSRLQDCLATFNEADYNRIMQQYKASEHADHEYTQIVVLVALLRQHFQRQQERHTHRGPGPSKTTSQRARANGEPTALDDSSSRLRLPALTKAKMAITSSFDNLRSRSLQTSLIEKKPGKSEEQEKGSAEDRKSFSLNMSKPASPLFSRRTSIDTLMAPIVTTPIKEGVSHGRNRSWTAGEWEHPQSDQPAPVNTTKKGEEQREVKTPQRPPRLNSRVLHQADKKERKSDRFSLTPPSVSVNKGSNFVKGHRRATSHGISRSLRQEIFDSVSTPTKLESKQHRRADSSDVSFCEHLWEDWQVIEVPKWKPGTQPIEGSPPTRTRQRWKDAINQQILLNRMEKENRMLKREGRKRLKMQYQRESAEALALWNQILEQEDPDSKDILKALVYTGVPPSCRERAWELLSKLYQAKNEVDWSFPDEFAGGEAFTRLGQLTTEYKHTIIADIGRTFPSHPYFASSLKEGGQSELYHILHAYAVADTETGYCQGLSFVTGIILMHTKDESSAFQLLYKLMNLYGYKDVYMGNLTILQLYLYQLSRLIYDFVPLLYQKLSQHDINPFFYAAPWFLTIFASQYPISFTARVFDMIFYEGTDALFKVSLSLLKFQEEELLKCASMETMCFYLKSKLPEAVVNNEDHILKQAMEWELGSRLKLFETEYKVMASLNERFHIDETGDMDIEILRKNNLAMIEELAICHGSIATLQEQVGELQQQLSLQQEAIKRLEEKLQ